MADSPPADIRFDPARAEDAAALVAMVREFHAEDGHPLDARNEATVVRVAKGEAPARAWIVRRATEAMGYLILTLGYSVEYGGGTASTTFASSWSCVGRASGNGCWPSRWSRRRRWASARCIWKRRSETCAPSGFTRRPASRRPAAG